jgi:hypothetical protein
VNHRMKLKKIIAVLLILIAVGIFLPYAFLTLLFEYPDVQHHSTGDNKSAIVWFAIVMLGLPLLAAYILLGQKKI